MPLRVELKPFERIVIGDSVIVNSGQRTSFLVEGDAPILRERDTITEDTADTPARRLYLCVQVMYLKGDAARYRSSYDELVRDLLRTAPQSRELLETVSRLVAEGALYRALRELRKLLKQQEAAAA